MFSGQHSVRPGGGAVWLGGGGVGTPEGSDGVTPLVLRELEMFRCPACGGALVVPDPERRIECTGCGHVSGIEEGIPLLFWPNEPTGRADVTEAVKAFYEETPFPNYDDLDSPESLRKKAADGYFARHLDEEIPHGARILECGCGTGQLSNFLGLAWGRVVVGTDICLNSLRLGQRFKRRHDVRNVCFVQMNLFRPAFREESFDLVISNGVLHHTADPFLGFRSLLRCLKKGGLIVVGLYNTYGRLTTHVRRLIFELSGDRFTSLDPRLRASLSKVRKEAWFHDQYRHPHESRHSFKEVLRWCDETGVEFVNSVPKFSASRRFEPDEPLFEPNPRGTALDHFVVQAGMLLAGGREGGFFTVIGRKRTSPRADGA